MKRPFSAIVAAVMAFTAMALPVTAEDASEERRLPFTLAAPGDVVIHYLDGHDSPSTCEIAYSQNNSMSEWASAMATDHEATLEDLQATYGYEDMYIVAQIDWSADDQEHWHVNDYWLTEGYDEDYVQHLGDWAYTWMNYSFETTNSEWIFRYMGDPDDPEDSRWFGRHEDGDDYDGWNDVLDPSLYTIVGEEGDRCAKLDFDNHTFYVRVRYLVNAYDEDEDKEYQFVSDWSEAAAVGKDAEKVEVLKPGDVEAPDISNLQYAHYDFNGWPVVTYQLAVSDKLRQQLTQASGVQGSIWIEVEGRVQGTEEWINLQGDWIVTAGKMESKLLTLGQHEGVVVDGTPLELRARYWITQDGQDDFTTDWSNVIKFSSWDVKMGDVNSDNSVDLSDYSDLAKFLAEWAGYDQIINYRTADLNKNGVPDLEDLSILAKYFSEWSGYAETYFGE